MEAMPTTAVESRTERPCRPRARRRTIVCRWSVVLLLMGPLVACSSDDTTTTDTAAPSTAAAAADSTTTTWPATEAAIPDGRILFNVEHAGVPSQPLYIDERGVHVIPVEEDPSFAHTVWSSADALIFDSERSGPRHLYSMDLDGADITQLTAGDESYARAAVSPVGSRLAFGAFLTDADGHDLGLHLADPDGGDLTRLTPEAPAGSQAFDDYPTFSPDGTEVAFVRAGAAGPGPVDLWVIRTDGSGLRQLTTGLTASYPRWSPDGAKILLTIESLSSTFVASPLWIVDVASGRAGPLTDGPMSGGWSEGDWSPDGSHIVFKYYEEGWDHNELRVANGDGSDPWTLWVSPPSLTAETPDWGR